MSVLQTDGFPLLERKHIEVMSMCPHNLEVALRGRIFSKVPEMSCGLNVSLVKRIVSYLVGKMRENYKPDFSFQQYVRAKTGSSKRRFLKAYNQLVRKERISLNGVTGIQAFVKNERYFEEGKKPRLIMGVKPEYNVLFCRHIARMEDAFFSLPQVANKCDYLSCGEKFHSLLGAWMGENDMSSFEGSQRKFHDFLEWVVYDGVSRDEDREDLLTLYAAQCHKHGRAGSEFEYSADWVMASGMLNTSIGNGIKNYIPTMYFQILNWCSRGADCRFDDCDCLFNSFVVKGDDSYMKIPVGANPRNYYTDWGYDAKYIVRQDPLLTEFCSGKFIRLNDGRFYYVQKLDKLLESLSVVINSDVVERGWMAHYYRSLGDMYAVLYKNIPVYEDLAKFLQRSSEKFRINVNLVSESFGASEAFANHQRNAEKVDVDTHTLLDVALVNEMTFSELDALVQYLRCGQLRFPPEHSRRCNLRYSRVHAVDEIDDSVVFEFDRTLDRKAQLTATEFLRARQSGDWAQILRDSLP